MQKSVESEKTIPKLRGGQRKPIAEISKILAEKGWTLVSTEFKSTREKISLTLSLTRRGFA